MHSCICSYGNGKSSSTQERHDTFYHHRKHFNFHPPIGPDKSHGQEVSTPVVVNHGEEGKKFLEINLIFYTAFSFILFRSLEGSKRIPLINIISESPLHHEAQSSKSSLFSHFKMLCLPKNILIKRCQQAYSTTLPQACPGLFETSSRYSYAQAEESFAPFVTF